VDPSILALVLASALMHAGWNLMAKRGHDGLVAMALIKAPNIVLAAAILAYAGLPAPASWPWLAASTCVNALYFYFLINAYRVGDLSLAYPVSRGMAPLLVLFLSLAVAGEVPSATAATGVGLICLGIFVLAARRGASREHRATLAWAAGVGMCIATYTVIDGIGGRASGNSVGYVALLNILTGVIVCGTATVRRGAAFTQALRHDWMNGLLGGAMMLGAYTIVVFALTQAPMAQVAALRESSVIFAAILGAIFLREPFGGRRVAASVAVAAGIAMLALGR
jgi:drug/metabolite transporter (DMT)-like permease